MKKIVSVMAIASIALCDSIPSGMTTMATNMVNMLKVCAKISTDDMNRNMDFLSDPSKCFNAYDIPFTSATGVVVSPVSLATKTAGEDFIFKIVKKPTCAVSNIWYSLVDDRGNDVPNTTKNITNPVEENFVSYKIPNSYKDVKVKFVYDLMQPATPYEVSCTDIVNDPHKYRFRFRFENMNQNELGTYVIPNDYKCYNISYGNISEIECSTDPTEYQFQFNFENMAQNRNGKFVLSTNYKCYKNYTTIHKIEYSSDNFAIKPDKFNIQFKKTTIKTGQPDYVLIQSLNKENGITTNYNNSSLILKPTFSENVNPQYLFDIKNGEARNGKVIFSKKASGVTMSLTDSDYTSVDADDTAQSCRNIEGTSNAVNVIEASKYWAGTGTNEVENNPRKNTVDSDIKQNTKKDLHFQKLGW